MSSVLMLRSEREPSEQLPGKQLSNKASNIFFCCCYLFIYLLIYFLNFYGLIIHMCIQGLGHFSPLPPPPPLPPTPPPPSFPHTPRYLAETILQGQQYPLQKADMGNTNFQMTPAP
jgi:hypothetical protein